MSTKLSKFILTMLFLFPFPLVAEAKKIEIEIDDDLQKIVDSFKGVSISGQVTTIYQSSSLNLGVGDLKDSSQNNLNNSQLNKYRHGNGSGSFSADLIITKEFNDQELIEINFQVANGSGADSRLQGGSMVNNDIMEDPDNINQPYLAKAFYQKTFNFKKDYHLTYNIGKFGVNDFFDIGPHNSDQTTQFLNQGIANNGAFDYVFDLQGHGYTYGARIGVGNDLLNFDLGFFSSDAYLPNIDKKHSIVGAITLNSNISGLPGTYQIYSFTNRGEYAAFDSNGNLMTKNASSINTINNQDSLNKNGFGISITQSITNNINLFAKFGQQDDDRDVRHFNDQDQSYLLGADFSGKLWKRPLDKIGVAFQQARLTGNHRKAHEKGYQSFFDRSGGIGYNNYSDEYVHEIYYRFALGEKTDLSLDYQHIQNFYYSKVIGSVDFVALRFNARF